MKYKLKSEIGHSFRFCLCISPVASRYFALDVMHGVIY